MPLAIFATLSFKPKPNVIPAAPNAANREEMWKPKGVSAIINAKILNMYLQKEDKKVITLFSCLLYTSYGETQGLPHKSKSMEEVIQLDGPAPEWFQKGVEAALLAPTAMNQQKFLFRLDKNRVCLLYTSNNSTTISTIQKICDGLEITVTDFFDSPLFLGIEQEIK